MWDWEQAGYLQGYKLGGEVSPTAPTWDLVKERRLRPVRAEGQWTGPPGFCTGKAGPGLIGERPTAC